MRDGSANDSGNGAGGNGTAGGSGGGIRRRDLLRGGVAAGLGAATLPLATSPAAAAEKDDAPRIRSYRTLGRTGLEIPDIGFGASRLGSDEELVRFALDRGVTYFD